MSDEGTPERQFAERVRLAREGRGWTQAQLAQAMTDEGVPTQYMTVAKIEKGTRSIKLNEAVALSSALGLTMPGPAPSLLLTDQNIEKAAEVAVEDLKRLFLNARHEVHEVARELAKTKQLFPRPTDPRQWIDESASNTPVTPQTLTKLVWASVLASELVPVLLKLSLIVEHHADLFRVDSGPVEDHETIIRESHLELRMMGRGDDDA